MKHLGLLACTGLSALLFCCGCGGDGGDKKLTTSKAGGVARFADGKPVTDLRVVLSPVGGGAFSPRGNLDADGRFQLTTYEKDDGAPAGKYKAYFSMAMAAEESGPPGAGGPTEKPRTGPPLRPESLVAKEYLSAASTPLEVEITAGGDNTKLELKDIKSPAK